jgi:hypothetical protein
MPHHMPQQSVPIFPTHRTHRPYPEAAAEPTVPISSFSEALILGAVGGSELADQVTSPAAASEPIRRLLPALLAAPS